ncbi:MAG: VOC family protein [Halioglobus sp.]
MNIDHINIAAPRALMEEVKRFYCTALQLEEGPRPDFGIAGYWLYGDGKPIVHLLESDNHGDAETPYFLDHVAYAMQDHRAYLRRLDELGVEHGTLYMESTNTTQIFCKDPCGVGVEANFTGEKPDT